MDLTDDMKLALAEQQAIIYEDYDAVKKINSKRLKNHQREILKESATPQKKKFSDKKKSATPTKSKSAGKAKNDIQILGLNALISDLKKKKKDKLSKNQSTADIDKQLKLLQKKRKSYKQLNDI